MPMSLSIAQMSSICSEVTSSEGSTRVELLVGDVAALLGELDHLLDGGVGEVEQRQRRIGGRLPASPSRGASSFFSFWAALILVAIAISSARLRAHSSMRASMRNPDVRTAARRRIQRICRRQR